MNDRCQQDVVGPGMGFHSHQCTRKAVRDGYCKQHHPDTVKERDEKGRQRFEEKRKREPWYVLQEVKEKLAVVEAENEWLKEIAIRAGAWQDKDGKWVYGNDKVRAVSEFRGQTTELDNTAVNIKPSDRKYYSFVEKGPGR